MFCNLSFKEGFEMGAQIATILAMAFAGWALLIGARAIKLQTKAIDLQRDATQLGLFSDFVKRIFDLEEKRNEYEKEGRIGEWCIQVLGNLEYFAYLANKEYLALELVKQYKGMIVEYHDNVLLKQKDTLAGYLKEDPEAFSELKKLYVNLMQIP
ncbi:MAG: hypothetical protein V1794_15855 [Candidatus Glassbacteria bacterium]